MTPYAPDTLPGDVHHLALVVQPVCSTPAPVYRVACCYKSYVKAFPPEVPVPPLFGAGESMRSFILDKRKYCGACLCSCYACLCEAVLGLYSYTHVCCVWLCLLVSNLYFSPHSDQRPHGCTAQSRSISHVHTPACTHAQRADRKLLAPWPRKSQKTL